MIKLNDCIKNIAATVQVSLSFFCIIVNETVYKQKENNSNLKE